MNGIEFASLASCIVSLSLGTFVYYKAPQQHLNRTFLWLCILLLYTAFTEFGLRHAATFAEARIWMKVGSFWPFSVSLAFYFTLVFTERIRLFKNRILLLSLHGPALVFSILDATTNLISGELVRQSWGWEYGIPQISIVSIVATIWSCILLILSLTAYIVYRALSDNRRKKQQTIFLLLGFSLPSLCFILNYSFLQGRFDIPDMTTPATLVGLLIIGYAIWRYELFALTLHTAACSIFRAMSNFLLLVSPNGVIQTVNPALLKRLGYVENELVGKNADVLFTDKAWRESTGRSETANCEVSVRTKGGEQVPVLLSVASLMDTRNELRGTVCVGSDLTEYKREEDRRKRAEQELRKYQEKLEKLVEERTVNLRREIVERQHVETSLRESEEKYRLLVENAADAIFIVQDNLVRFWNLKTEEITCCNAEELSSIPFVNLIHSEDNDKYVDDFLKGLEEQNSPIVHSFRMVNHAGEKLWVQLRVVQITWEGRAAILCFLRDITLQRNLESQLLQSQKLEAVGTLAGGIAHDFNNFLQAIQGYAQILLWNIRRDDPGFEELKEIEKAVQKASELTQQLLIFSRKGESKLRSMNLNQEVKQLTNLLKRTIPKMINIELHLAEDLFLVKADATQIQQTLMNLAVNAKDAMPQTGNLVFQTENVTLKDEDVVAYGGIKPGNYVRLTIADTGQGMDKEVQEHIFEPFYTTKPTGLGTGLGLSMVYGIVNHHGGHITCDSVKGEGTTFAIYLPAIKKEAEVLLEQREDEIHAGGTEMILLVDDETSLRRIGESTLSKLGYSVLTASDGESALELYGQRMTDISLIVLDLIMPGIGGLKCLEKLLTLNPRAKILIASGYSPEGMHRRVMEAGAKAIIHKPYRVSEMLKAIREMLDKEDLPLP